MSDPNLLIGTDHFSDAGVYRLAPNLAIVQTVDFFSPIVDDPYIFGQIAAANALSDCYAMGAQPKTVLNIVGFPDKDLELEVLTEILRGGAERVLEAGAVVVGGHSVRDSEVKYGLAVTGVVDPAKMMTNSGARAGDALVLTKGLGTGLLTTAHKKGNCNEIALAAAQESMVRLNKSGSEAALALEASGATDITGFGLAVHAQEMALASDVTIAIDCGQLPALPGALEAATSENHSRANSQNRSHAERSLKVVGAPDQRHLELCFDPQTSGGLLISIDASRATELVDRCRASGQSDTAVVGEVLERQDVSILLRP